MSNKFKKTCHHRNSEIPLVSPCFYSSSRGFDGVKCRTPVPNTLAWTGIALLVGAGLYMLHSERARARAALEAAAD
jgi:hypothetical protein